MSNASWKSGPPRKPDAVKKPDPQDGKRIKDNIMIVPLSILTVTLPDDSHGDPSDHSCSNPSDG